MTCRAAAVLLAAACLAGAATEANAEARFALIVSGATGGEDYAVQYRSWTTRFVRTLEARLKFDPGLVTVLTESDDAAAAATAANVRKAVASVRQRMTRDDLLLVLLVGHGTFDGSEAKFNLVGPDLSASEWASLLDPLAGNVVFVNGTAGSFPFLERLAGPRRIVITATDSEAQRFDTIFPEHFLTAFDDEAADLDKNQRISIWEAFAYASAGVKREYQQRGLLATERSLLDDDGDGAGKGAGERGADGALASRTYLDESLPGAAPTDEELLKLLQRKALIEAELDELKIRKAFLPAEEYGREFERIIIELARVSRAIRHRMKT